MSFEVGIEKVENFKIEIDDKRTNPDTFKGALEKSLDLENIDTKLAGISQFFGEYGATKPTDLSIRLIDGKFGEGTIKDSTIEVQIPDIKNLVSETKTALGSLLEKNSEEEKEVISKQLILAVISSTILHEGTHGLLDSKPGSKFATEVEELSGIENIEGKISTLLDEGIVYAIQEIYAPEIKPIGSIAPRINENDREDVKMRKELGHRLRPIVENYLNLGKSMDRNFIAMASQELKEILINSQI